MPTPGKSPSYPPCATATPRRQSNGCVGLLGFAQHMVVPGENDGIAHAQLVLGDGMIMVGSARDDATVG